jgi:hypothetical protein
MRWVSRGSVRACNASSSPAWPGNCPPDQCLPEIWIDHPEQEARARQLLHDLQHVPQQRWRCACGEQVEGGFEQCWQCGCWMPR